MFYGTLQSVYCTHIFLFYVCARVIYDFFFKAMYKRNQKECFSWNTIRILSNGQRPPLNHNSAQNQTAGQGQSQDRNQDTQSRGGCAVAPIHWAPQQVSLKRLESCQSPPTHGAPPSAEGVRSVSECSLLPESSTPFPPA